ncbi:chymotrypsin-like protease CTRL-1 [Physella acuta]|uniref:chymotrypsin-like protease CTRL-1 n=1 Tax=Physella acuta TaxID=109671 RepID=UPI0027DB2984|nr:chymotrypsin-like protease CTRL-1 [Physella acuta]
MTTDKPPSVTARQDAGAEIARGVCGSYFRNLANWCQINSASRNQTLRLQVVRQISLVRCIQGLNYGLTVDNSYIWVTGLCEAEFSVLLTETSTTNPTLPQAPTSTLPSKPLPSNDKKDQCGAANYYRIIGGTGASPCQYPWMVMVTNSLTETMCGGAIIDSIHVLTAAHCFYAADKRTGEMTKALPGQIVVLTGSTVIDLKTLTGLKVRFVAKLSTHELYNSKTLANDIAVLRLTSPIEFDRCHQPVCLVNHTMDVHQASHCRAMGWGVNSNDVTSSAQSTLQWIDMPVVDDVTCRQQYRSLVTPSTFCAGAKGKDTCRGDSGGPFICRDDGPRYHVYGVVSAGLDQQCGNYVGLYTKVSSFLGWIGRVTAT